MVSVERLREVLAYDANTGVFSWKLQLSNRTKVGKPAGSIKPDGYVCIDVDGKRYKAHRLAWLYVYGDTDLEIDHINGIPGDNRITNLRPVTHQQNLWNSKKPTHNTSGYKGVHLHKASMQWRAVAWDRKPVHLGLFDTKEKAQTAYIDWCKINRGEYARVS
jgi:hypothetical protein